MNKTEWIGLSERYLMNTYRRAPVVFERGEGVRLWDCDGREYLDFLAGIAVCSLGHAHPRVVEAIRRQAGRLMHVSNLYQIEPQILAAQAMCERSFADKIFFCNSGAEANEAVIKLARKYGHERLGGRYEIVTMLNSFHGRTLATITATGQTKFQAGFEPLPSGFRYAPYDDVKALADAVTDRTCAILVEPIQGEGGIRIPAPTYLQEVRALCDARGILLMLDEVQTGIGRTGTLFAYEQAGIRPDVMTLAKALGNGFPVGAMLATEEVARVFEPGTHASTFGGNPLAMAAVLSVLEAIDEEGLLENCLEMGAYFLQRLNALKRKHSLIRDIRGRGLLIGCELDCEGAPYVSRCMQEGLLINCTNANVLRFAPPLVVTAGDIDRAVDILDAVLGAS